MTTRQKSTRLTIHLAARTNVIYIMGLRYIRTTLRSCYKWSRICIRRTRQARPNGRILDEAKNRAARRHFQMRNPARFHAGHPRGNRRNNSNSLRRIPRHVAQPPIQELQPLYVISLQEAHREPWTRMAEPSRKYRYGISLRRPQRMGRGA